VIQPSQVTSLQPAMSIETELLRQTAQFEKLEYNEDEKDAFRDNFVWVTDSEVSPMTLDILFSSRKSEKRHSEDTGNRNVNQ
jgi:hypothetical protein